MLTKIDIKNYRGIRSGTVEGFSAVNILVGPNGSGKSTLLEAIFLAADRERKYWANRWSPSGSPESGSLLGARHNESVFPNPAIVFGKNKGSEVEIAFHGKSAAGAWTFNWLYNSGKNRDALTSTAGPDFATAPGDNSSLREVETARDKFREGLKLLDVRLLLDNNCEQLLWQDLLDIRGDRVLCAQLNGVYNLDIENFTYTYAGSLKTLFSNRDFALNVDDLGAGIRIALRLFMALALTKNSAVLVEEFDGYQHIETLPKFARTVLALSQEADSQLFLATHSLETVRAFVDAANAVPLGDEGLAVYQTALDSSGVLTTSRLSSDDCQTLLDGDFDLRRSK